MIQTTQLDFLTYTLAFKNNYEKGINRLKAILQSPSQANALVNNLGGVSAIFGAPVDAPDPNSEELIQIIHNSPYAAQAAKTWLDDFYTFGTWDDLLQDDGKRKKILNTPTHIRAVMSSREGARAVIDNPEYVHEIVTSPTAMDAIVASPTIMAEMAASPTVMAEMVKSEMVLRAICANQIGADVVKTAIQQHRNTIMKTLSSPTLFSIGNTSASIRAGTNEIAMGVANIIICMYFASNEKTAYTAYYGANVSEPIYVQPRHSEAVNIKSNGISMRGLKIVGTGEDVYSNFGYLIYTPK